MQLATSPQADSASFASARALLLLLLATDLAFIVLHVLYIETSLLRGRPFSLEADNGLPEAYQYVKLFWLVLCMAALFRRTRAVVYVGWAVVFAFLLLDDAFQFHERSGRWLDEQYSLPVILGLRANDIGELLFAAAVGGVTAVLIGFGFWRGDAQARLVSRDLAILLVTLAILGVGIDLLHVIAYLEASLLAQFLLILEDGGEMIVVSFMTAYAFNALNHEGRATVDLWSRLRSLGSRATPSIVNARAAAQLPLV